jgi:AcrR family transcriptional regulator
MILNGYEKRTNAKKTAIIEAARELFTVRGIQDVSISEIARRANVSQVSIYNYFGDKNLLAREAFLSYIEQAINEYEKILASDISFAEKLELIIQDKSDMISQVALSNFNEKALDDKSLLKIFGEAIQEKAAALYHSFIEMGKNESAINNNIPTEAAMNFVMMSIQLFKRPDFLTSSDEYKLGMMNLFLYGLIGKKD